jgi:putative DNA primase/helicase
MEMARALGREAANMGSREAFLLAYKTQSNRNIQDMLKLSQNTMGISQAALDADPLLFNCLTGTINLRDGSSRLHDPQDRISKLASVDFRPEAKCPTWRTFLDRIMARSESLIGSLAMGKDTVSPERAIEMWSDS